MKNRCFKDGIKPPGVEKSPVLERETEFLEYFLVCVGFVSPAPLTEFSRLKRRGPVSSAASTRCVRLRARLPQVGVEEPSVSSWEASVLFKRTGEDLPAFLRPKNHPRQGPADVAA